MSKLKCDMKTDCTNAVTHVDNKGFIYCRCHGEQRQNYCSCRKLTTGELKKLESGQPIRFQK